MRSGMTTAIMVGAALLSTACGSGDPLEDIDGVRTWANRTSAVGVWSQVHDVVAAGAGRDPFRDPECPVVVTDGDTTTVTGGCTANDDQTWVGSATVVRTGEDQDITIMGFGHAEDVGLVTRLDGTTEIRGMPDGRHRFVMDLRSDAVFGGVTTIAYDGVVEGDYTSPTTWNGSGTFELDGQTVTATTTDEVWDEGACRGAPAAGQTQMVSALHTAVLTYDGASECDEDRNVPWTLDGEDMGMIDGITCAASGGRPGSMLFLGLVGGALLLRLRRLRTHRTSTHSASAHSA